MKCFVPTCGNDSNNSTKIIIKIREDLREKWWRKVNVEYFKCYTQYCCEDHFDPEQDLKNRYFKSANQEPRFKPTAKLRNIGVHLQEEVYTGLQEDKSELAKSLLQSEPKSQKRRCDEVNKPSISGIISSPATEPEQDLKNINIKSANQEPRTKQTAKLRNIGVHLQEELFTGLQKDGSELAKLLLQSESKSKKRRYEDLRK